MNLALGVVMDPMETIKPYKDSTFAMMLEAQKRGWDLWYMEISDLFMNSDRAWATRTRVTLVDRDKQWHSSAEQVTTPLDDLDVILMRKDPPFDLTYVITTYLLEAAERHGTLVVNPAATLRDNNEKLTINLFPQCCAPSVVSRDPDRLRQFVKDEEHAVVKPVDSMGGHSIFRVSKNDPNLNVILETVTSAGSEFVMAQRFIPEISSGDKRILMVDGEPVPYALARIPKKGEFRGNLAVGGRGSGQPLSERDYWIAEQVGPFLKKEGILFAGLDVIGDYLTEVNITSPTCIRELDSQFNLNISAQLMDVIEKRCNA